MAAFAGLQFALAEISLWDRHPGHAYDKLMNLRFFLHSQLGNPRVV
jgi:hypothetical protein